MHLLYLLLKYSMHLTPGTSLHRFSPDIYLHIGPYKIRSSFPDGKNRTTPVFDATLILLHFDFDPAVFAKLSLQLPLAE